MEDDVARLRTCLATFGLEPGATIDAVKKARLTLIKVWHPDRFESEPKLRTDGEEKLKEINAAYQWLNEHRDLLRPTASPESDRPPPPRRPQKSS